MTGWGVWCFDCFAVWQVAALYDCRVKWTQPTYTRVSALKRTWIISRERLKQNWRRRRQDLVCSKCQMIKTKQKKDKDRVQQAEKVKETWEPLSSSDLAWETCTRGVGSRRVRGHANRPFDVINTMFSRAKRPGYTLFLSHRQSIRNLAQPSDMDSWVKKADEMLLGALFILSC